MLGESLPKGELIYSDIQTYYSFRSVFPLAPVDALWSSIIWRSPVWRMLYSDSGFIVHLLSLSLLLLLCPTQALPLWSSGGPGTSWWSGGIGRRVSNIQGSHEFPERPRKHLLHFLLTLFLEPACENDQLSGFIRALEPPCGTVHSPP